MLYRNKYKHLHECPCCGLSRYKREGDGGSEGPPTKVLWYLPIIHRFKRMSQLKEIRIIGGGM